MSGEDEEYELLSHDQVERLRQEAHQGEGDFVEMINVLRRTHESVEDLRGLLSTVKDNVLEDYAEAPNPESILERVKTQNEKIAEGMVTVLKRLNSVEDQQQKILSELDDQPAPTPSSTDASQQKNGSADQAGSEKKVSEEQRPKDKLSEEIDFNSENPAGVEEDVTLDDEDEFADLDGLDDVDLDEGEADKDSGLFSNLLSG